ncbi:hypothetical protein GGF37_000722 [Kickxella alabastrina]|nr:hypothetical protein GGF37_000722 [Kickxella alabastrina]
MSQIDIHYSKAQQTEFCLIETQGSLETDIPGGLNGQQRFGQIERLPDGKVIMKIGIHRAAGSVVPLKKPLAVMTKRCVIDDNSDNVNDNGVENEDSTVAYDIKAIIKEKFIFKMRPEVNLQQEILKLPII